MKRNALIIGVAKGLGNELFTKLADTYEVLGTQRSIHSSSQIPNIIKLDLQNEDSMNKAVALIKDRSIKFDLVLFVAAKTSSAEPSRYAFGGPFSVNDFQEYYQVNCISPLKLFESLFFHSILESDCRSVFFSSLAGSIQMRGLLKHNRKGGNLAYRVSKAALNAGVKNIAYDLRESGQVLICLHPGWVRTQSGGTEADLSLQDAADAICSLIKMLGSNQSGKFLNLAGEVIPW